MQPRSLPPGHDAEVIIAGGGPVGLGLAITLGQRGVRVIVIERYPEPQPIPRGQNLTQRTMEHFHFWGTEKELRAARTIPRDFGIGGMTTYGTLLSGYHYDWMQRELVRPFYFTDNERLPQYATEAVLRRRVAALDTVTTIYGWSATDLTETAEGVTVAIAERNGEGRRSLRARYVVGCDGARSLVRENAGITETRIDHDRLMVLLVFRSTGLHKLLERFPGKSFISVLNPALDGYWQFFGRVDLGTTWFFHAPVPFGTTRDNYDFKALVHSAVGAPFDVEFDHIGFWDLRVAVADHYRAGPFFIAGDAAHSHPPYGGYGINTGFEDAANLGWKLAASLEGWAGPHLLDSYGAERRPVFASTANDFIERSIRDDREFLRTFNPKVDKAAFEAAWLGRQTGATSEVHAFEPHYEGSAVVFGPEGGVSSAVGRHRAEARAGHHLTPRKLTDGRDVYEALGSGFTLIALDAADQVVSGFTEAAEALGIPLRVIRDDRTDARADYGASLILVRPDQYVAWTSISGAVEARAVLARAAGHGAA
ncbi:MAG: FAD-dependent monooxygenase [Alphaproteobacteria bacterium]